LARVGLSRSSIYLATSILSNDGTLPNLLTPGTGEPPTVSSALPINSAQAISSAQPTLKDFERDLILHTLQSADWVTGGASGAAAKLGAECDFLAGN